MNVSWDGLLGAAVVATHRPRDRVRAVAVAVIQHAERVDGPGLDVIHDLVVIARRARGGA